MSNLRLCYLNRADAATLTVSPAADSDAPVTYLQQDARGYVMAVTSTGAVISGEWGGTAYTIGCCALYRHNLLTNDTWRLQLYSDSTWTTQVYDSTALDVYPDGIYDDWDYAQSVMWFTAVTGVKSFKLTLATAGATVEAARLILGPYTEATYNPLYGVLAGWEDDSDQMRTGAGSLRTRVGNQWRTMTWDMFVTSEADRAAWMEIGRYAGKVKTLLVSMFPGAGGTSERDYCLVGKFTESPIDKFSRYNQHDLQVVMKEL